MNPNCSDASFWPDDGIILYDGICVLCSGWMRFVLDRDTRQLFRFTPIQSPYGRALAKALGIDPDDPDTNAVVIGGVALRRSDAALVVVSRLPGWGWVPALRLVPRPLRDLVYRLIARTRYRVFGRHQICDIGAGRYASRVITESQPRQVRRPVAFP
jgi:predicted DCC family thiol-disulfide oxidoreductase YuxK